MYDVHGRISGARSTRSRVPQMPNVRTSTHCTAPATYSCARDPNRYAMRCATSKSTITAPNAGRKTIVASHERIGCTMLL